MNLMAQVVLNGVAVGAGYSLVAFGFAIIYRVGRFLHFAHGAVYTWAAYATYALHVLSGWPLVIAICVAIVLSAALGALLDATVHRALRRRRASPLVLLVASIGIFTVLVNLVPMVFGDSTRTLRGDQVHMSHNLLGVYLSLYQIATISGACVVYCVMWYLFRHTRIGIAMQAVAADRELAEICGVPATRVTTVAFALGSGMAALAASLAALDVDLTPGMGVSPLIAAIVAIVLGGAQSLPGAALAGLGVGIVQNLAGLVVGSRWQDAVLYSVMLIALIVRPHGLFGRAASRLQGTK